MKSSSKLIFEREPSPAQVYNVLQWAPWADKRGLNDIRRMLWFTDVAVLAFEEGDPVGFARALTDFTFRTFIEDVVVVPEKRNEGIGTRLVEEVESQIMGMGDMRIELKTKIPRFWESMGYVEDEGGYNSFTMVKEL